MSINQILSAEIPAVFRNFIESFTQFADSVAAHGKGIQVILRLREPVGGRFA
jgi:hypothetical protein